MTRPPLELRPARPTLEEGLVFARYLDEAAEGFIRFMLGRRAAETVARAYVQPDNDYSFENVIFAERDGVIVGMALGFTGLQHRRFSDQLLKQAAGPTVLRLRTVRVLCAPLLRILTTIPDGDFYLLGMAVEGEMRGEGIGSAVMDGVEARARAAGSARLSLDVAAKNEGARRFYERRGMSVESRWPRLRFVSPLFFRMTKTL